MAGSGRTSPVATIRRLFGGVFSEAGCPVGVEFELAGASWARSVNMASRPSEADAPGRPSWPTRGVTAKGPVVSGSTAPRSLDLSELPAQPEDGLIELFLGRLDIVPVGHGTGRVPQE